jgi:hypothetical protein
MRLKLIRDGYQDHEYLKLAASANPGQASAIAGNLFPSMYDTNRSDSDIAAARRALAHLIDPSNIP